MKIDIVKVYRIRHPRNPASYRRTLEGAFRKLAWGMIFEKYDNHGRASEQIVGQYPIRLKCDCYENSNPSWGQACEWEGCEIHDRHDGYYRKLHTRLVSYLLSKYQSDEMPAHFRKEIKNDG